MTKTVDQTLNYDQKLIPQDGVRVVLMEDGYAVIDYDATEGTNVLLRGLNRAGEAITWRGVLIGMGKTSDNTDWLSPMHRDDDEGAV